MVPKRTGGSSLNGGKDRNRVAPANRLRRVRTNAAAMIAPLEADGDRGSGKAVAGRNDGDEILQHADRCRRRAFGSGVRRGGRGSVPHV